MREYFWIFIVSIVLFVHIIDRIKTERNKTELKDSFLRLYRKQSNLFIFQDVLLLVIFILSLAGIV